METRIEKANLDEIETRLMGRAQSLASQFETLSKVIGLGAKDLNRLRRVNPERWCSLERIADAKLSGRGLSWEQLKRPPTTRLSSRFGSTLLAV